MKLNSDAKPIPYGEEIGKTKQEALAERNAPVEFSAPLGNELASEMTKREAFAMAALQGLCAGSGMGASWDRYAMSAVGAADALIAELQK